MTDQRDRADSRSASASGSAAESALPQWPQRLRELSGQILAHGEHPAPESVRAELWRLLHLALRRYARHHAKRLGGVAPEDLEDIVSQKALELFRRIERRREAIFDDPPARIVAFLSTIARNGLVDRLREISRRVSVDSAQVDEQFSGGSTRSDEDAPQPIAGRVALPGEQLAQREFAIALRRCAEELKPRARLAWLFRVFYSMSSRQIAAHPEIGLKSSHIDVILQRARQSIRECMSRRGYRPEEMPPGVFFELWKAFRLPSARPNDLGVAS